MSEMTVKEIVADWLKAHDCEGLYSEDCGCKLDDLMPCGEPNFNCVAAVNDPAEHDPEVQVWMTPKQFPDEAKGEAR